MNLNRLIRDYPKLVERVEALERALKASKVDNQATTGSKLPLQTASERPLPSSTLTLRKKESLGGQVRDTTPRRTTGGN